MDFGVTDCKKVTNHFQHNNSISTRVIKLTLDTQTHLKSSKVLLEVAKDILNFPHSVCTSSWRRWAYNARSCGALVIHWPDGHWNVIVRCICLPVFPSSCSSSVVSLVYLFSDAFSHSRTKQPTCVKFMLPMFLGGQKNPI